MLDIKPHSTEARQGAVVDSARTALFLDGPRIPVYEEELWTSKQRQASSIHGELPRAALRAHRRELRQHRNDGEREGAEEQGPSTGTA